MILYFSGTGNSAFVARKIAKDLQDDYMNLFDRIRNKDYGEIHSDRPFIVVCPTLWLANSTFFRNMDGAGCVYGESRDVFCTYLWK